MNRAISSVLVAGLCVAGYTAVEPTVAAAVRGSPYSGKFVGRIPGSDIVWPITIDTKGAVSAVVTQRLAQSLPTPMWGSFSGTVDSGGLLHCTGIQFVQNTAGGFVSFVLDVQANVTLSASGSIVGDTTTGDTLAWSAVRVTTSK